MVGGMLPESLAASSLVPNVSTLNTRRLERYRVSGDVSLSLNPLGSEEITVRAGLIDINRAGGMGIFVGTQHDLDSLWLASVLGRWRFRRETTSGPVTFSVKLLHAVPRRTNGRLGLRISAMPASQKPSPAGPRFFTASRRRVERSSANPLPVTLIRDGRKLRGRLLNISESDGFGVQLESSALVKVRIGELFDAGWQVTAASTTLPCILKRIGCQQGNIVVGAVAPGLSRVIQAQSVKVARTPAAASTPGDEDDFTRMLDEVLSRKLRNKLN
jgi:hypothetical protein